MTKYKLKRKLQLYIDNSYNKNVASGIWMPLNNMDWSG